MTAECVNLKEQFGDRFKVTYEESYRAERGDNGRAEDPWLMVMLCQHGEIYPYGDDQLVASTKVAGGIARALKALPFTTLHQDGTDGVDVIFPADRFEDVAAIMKPRKRRRMTEEAKQQAAKRLRKYQPRKGQSVADVVRQRANRGQFSDPSTQDDSEPIPDFISAQTGLQPGANPVTVNYHGGPMDGVALSKHRTRGRETSMCNSSIRVRLPLLAWLFVVSCVLLSPNATALATEAPQQQAPLLLTRWGQRDDYASFAPRNERVGCWSTALAQILFYHGLFPEGSVSYRCSDDTELIQNLGSHRFSSRRFVPTFTPATPPLCKQEVARYLYFTSLAIQKDFGTGSYCLTHSKRAEAIARHFACETRFLETPSTSLKEIAETIVNEVSSKRPVMMHMRDRAQKTFHAVAVDGYRFQGNLLWLHVNMGHGGHDDGWFRFDQPVGKYDDVAYRETITVRPPQRLAPEVAEADTSTEKENSPTNVGPQVRRRVWTDATGKYTIEATLLDFSNGQVSLTRPDGKNLDVPLARLSADDQKYVREFCLARDKARKNTRDK